MRDITDKREIEIFYDNYKLYYRIIYSVLQNNADTEDVLQDVSCTLLTEAFDGSNPRALKRMIAVISKNAAIDLLRKNNREYLVDSVPEDSILYSDDIGLDDFFFRETVHAVLQSIPFEVRDALREHVLYGFSILSLTRKYGVPFGKLRYWKNIFYKSIKEYYK